jgi:dGTPase
MMTLSRPSHWPTTSVIPRSATPGQEALNQCMQGHGGFEHNLQSLRIVDRLEERYGAFDGPEPDVRNARGASSSIVRPARARELGEVGQRFLDDPRPSLEAQICNLADEIAYNNHDVDDGLRSGVLTLEQLQGVSLFARHAAEVSAEFSFHRRASPGT